MKSQLSSLPVHVEVITNSNELYWSFLLCSYAPWCPHCRSFESVWEEFGQWADTEDDLSVGKVDVTTQPGGKRGEGLMGMIDNVS